MSVIKKIKIPVKPENLSYEAIEPYLSDILDTFEENARNLRKFYTEYENQHQEILSKTRKYDDQSETNYKTVDPHLFAMVNFKTGYCFGNPIEYAQTQEKNYDDIKFLLKYFKNSKKRSVDKAVGTWIYAGGVGYYFIEPKKKVDDINSQAPFDIFAKDSDTCCKVYSSYNGEKPLFDILYTKLEEKSKNGITNDKVILSLYFPNKYYEIEYSFGQFKKIKEVDRKLYRYLPLVEKYANESRIGIVEIGKSLNDALDRAISNSLDNIEDIVNELLVFRNTILGESEEEKRSFLINARRNGAIIINDKSPEVEADVKTISSKLTNSDVMVLLEEIKQDLYDTCGVPLASSDVTSGGDTQGARVLGNGWENAYNRVLDDINSFLGADYEVLERILFICKNSKDCPVNELTASDIEIKYNPNMTDNMLVKSQSYTNYINANVPHILAMKWCRVTNDPETDNKIVQENLNKIQAEENQAERNANEVSDGITGENL